MSISFKWALRDYRLEDDQRILIHAKNYRGKTYQLPTPVWGTVESLATSGLYFYAKIESNPDVQLEVPTYGFFLEDEIPVEYLSLLEEQRELKPRVLEFLKSVGDWRSMDEIFDRFNKDEDSDIALCLVQLMSEGHILFHKDVGFAFDH